MRQRRSLAFLLAAGCLAAFGSGRASAGSAPEASGGETQARLLAGPRDGAVRTAGIAIHLAPGWKTYWRYPGDAGIPPAFDWSGSRNVARVEVDWPAPQRFDEGGSTSIGYKRDVVLPLRITPQDATAPVELKLDMQFAVCNSICQPASADMALTLPPDAAGETDASASRDLADAQAQVPKPARLGAAPASAPAIETVEVEPGQPHPLIRVVARLSDAQAGDLFVEGPSEDWALPLPERRTDAQGRTVFELPAEGIPKGASLAGTPLRFTLVDPAGAVEVTAQLQ